MCWRHAAQAWMQFCACKAVQALQCTGRVPLRSTHNTAAESCCFQLCKTSEVTAWIPMLLCVARGAESGCEAGTTPLAMEVQAHTGGFECRQQAAQHRLERFGPALPAPALVAPSVGCPAWWRHGLGCRAFSVICWLERMDGSSALPASLLLLCRLLGNAAFTPDSFHHLQVPFRGGHHNLAKNRTAAC